MVLFLATRIETSTNNQKSHGAMQMSLYLVMIYTSFCLIRIWESSRPAGPPPMMPTGTRIAASLRTGRLCCRRRQRRAIGVESRGVALSGRREQ